MKTKVFLLALSLSIGALGAHAQKGVDTGTQFGSGEDSIRCITNISLFIPYAKAGNYKDAFEFWQIVYDECPAATKDIYLYGARIVAWEIANENDAAKKDALVDKLMGVYDKRVKYFGNDRRYGKDWIVGRKAQDYMQFKGEDADYAKMYGWLKEVVDESNLECDALAVSLYMFSSLRLLAADPDVFKPNYIEDYLKATAIYDAQIAAAQAANNEKELASVTSFKQAIDANFANSGAADCETLQNMYAEKVEQNKDNLEYLNETLSLLKRVRCTDIDVYFAASRYVHLQVPTAESALGLGKQAVRDKDFNKAIEYFEQAISLDNDPSSQADNYYMIALLLFDQSNYSKARQYCLKTVEANPNYGKAYILIGQMYAMTAKSIYPNDAVMTKIVYNTSIDKFERARQVDPEVAAEANRLISTYRAYLPSTEEIFMHPDLEKGKQVTIGGWIGERTTIR